MFTRNVATAVAISFALAITSCSSSNNGDVDMPVSNGTGVDLSGFDETDIGIGVPEFNGDYIQACRGSSHNKTV